MEREVTTNVTLTEINMIFRKIAFVDGRANVNLSVDFLPIHFMAADVAARFANDTDVFLAAEKLMEACELGLLDRVKNALVSLNAILNAYCYENFSVDENEF